ncbi:hypothetical protein Tco_0841919 [Tanacetum coccineum]|uniref:Zinc knuckle CX2CX4HX4C domain-containing protein n=1 Tax=Tanacetum coccineum TaxID=301880 RepID=A0ABQ5B022_9ASTR
MQSWGCMDYARDLVDIRDNRVLKETTVISVPNLDGNCATFHTFKVKCEWKPPMCGTCLVFSHNDEQCPKRVIIDLRKQVGPSHDGFQTVPINTFHGPVEMTSTPVSNAFDALSNMDDNDQATVSCVIEVKTKEDKGKYKDYLVEDTRKNAKPIQRKSFLSTDDAAIIRLQQEVLQLPRQST